MLSMPECSVILPDTSTAELPDVTNDFAGHSTGMDLSGILARIEKRLHATGLSDNAASALAGKPDAIRNIRRAIAAGRKGVSTATIAALAPVLGTRASWLLSEDGPETADHVDLRSEDIAATLDKPPRRRSARIKGYVGAGSEAHYYALADEDFEEVDAPLGSSDRTVAVEIRGKSLGPLMANWLVFYDDVRSPVTTDLIGRLCVVGLSDDRILVKKIERNGRGGFQLLSNSGDEPIDDVKIEWAAKVTALQPRS